MDIILNDLKAKYDLISYNIKQNMDELDSLTINTFILNPRINELTKELKTLFDEKEKIKEKIDKLENNNKNGEYTE